MGAVRRTAIGGRWCLAFENGRHRLLRDHYVLVEGTAVAAVLPERPAGVDRVVEIGGGLILPGFLNLHNHLLSAVLTRGLSEDRTTASYATDLVYGLLMPLGDAAVQCLAEDEMRAAMRLALLEIIKGGTTTLMDVFRVGQSVTVEVAEEMGLRFYGAPYILSTSKLAVDSGGRPVYETEAGRASDLDRAIDLFHRYDGRGNGRIRMALGPHGPDTCAPDLLRAVRRAADELHCLVTIHMAQSTAELEIIRERHGLSPAGYLESVGLLGPDVLVAHGICASDEDLDLLRRTGTTLVNCPQTFARGGLFAPFARFAERGVRTVLGTDGYCNDFLGEMRAAGLVSKLHAGRSDAATAHDLVEAATLTASQALGRGDLGRLAPGCQADLLVVDLDQPHFQPVADPVKALVWNGRGSDIALSMVAGEVLVNGGRYTRGDEAAIVAEGAQAIEKAWAWARERGLLAPERFASSF